MDGSIALYKDATFAEEYEEEFFFQEAQANYTLGSLNILDCLLSTNIDQTGPTATNLQYLAKMSIDVLARFIPAIWAHKIPNGGHSRIYKNSKK